MVLAVLRAALATVISATSVSSRRDSIARTASDAARSVSTKDFKGPNVSDAAIHAAADAASAASEGNAELAAHSAAYAGDVAEEAWAAATIDATRLEIDPPDRVFLEPLWTSLQAPSEIRDATEALFEYWLSDEQTWGFWHKWFQGFLYGNPLDWDIQLSVALIADESWIKGPAHIAREIDDLLIEFEGIEGSGPTDSEGDARVSPSAARNMSKRMAVNHEAIALVASGLIDHISNFRESIRGNNQIETAEREGLLEFLDNLLERLAKLLQITHENSVNPTRTTGEKGVLWLRSFKVALQKSGKEYLGPENIAVATIPTSIILGCTGIGSLLGMPVAGTVVGGLLTGQLKPAKAVEDILRPSSSSTNP